MPSVLFIGGPLDGELLDSDGVNIQSRGIHGTYKDGVDLAVTTAVVPLSTGYHIANGIARHESVSEEELARRVHAAFYDCGYMGESDNYLKHIGKDARRT